MHLFLLLRPVAIVPSLLIASVVAIFPFTIAAHAADIDIVSLDAPDPRFGPPPPDIEELDQAYLVTRVRQAMHARLRGQPASRPAFVPLTLQEVVCPVVVTLTRDGLPLGRGEAENLPVVEGCLGAGEAALDDLQSRRTLTEDLVDEIRVSLSLCGPAERVGVALEAADRLAGRFEPAIHGITLRMAEQQVRLLPSDLISLENACDEDSGLLCDRYARAIDDLRTRFSARVAAAAERPHEVAVLRFRETHLYEPVAGGKPVELIAGLRLIRPDEVTQQRLLTVVDELAAFIRYRQNANGLFAYEYLPGTGLYRPGGQNWIRQAATTWALATHATRRQDEASAQVLQKALAAFGQMVRPLRDRRDASYIATPDGEHALGTTALVTLALFDAPQPERYEELRASLLTAIEAMQLDDGSFTTHFPPSTARSSQDYYPGEALLAIARQYAAILNPRWREICDRALPFYRDYYRTNKPAPFVPWQAQAWGVLARSTYLERYAEFVYEMSDALAGTQIDSLGSTVPIYDGGFDVYGGGRCGISSAVYLEGFVDALRTAETLGDRQRADRYREAVRRAARFVMQLQFRPEECYYVKSPRDVIGAMRNTPSDPSLRIDHVQHGLAALLGASESVGSASTATRPVTAPATSPASPGP